MEFYLEIWNDKNSLVKVEYPCIILESNGWDDYGYKTLFQVYHCKKRYHQEYIGDIKVLSQKAETTIDVMPKIFEQLDSTYCTLGQSIDYYRKVDELDEKSRDLLINGLNDVIFNNDIYMKFKSDEGMELSLKRNSEAARIVNNREKIRKNIDFEGNQVFSYVFETKLENIEMKHVLDIDFTKEHLPNRVIALIGKNATGKTKVLSDLVEAMIYGKRKKFSEVPNYSKVIAVSYSIFDDFCSTRIDSDVEDEEVKNKSKQFNYVYCGLIKNNRIISRSDLIDKYKKSIQIIRDKGRKDKWKDIINQVFDYAELDNIEETILNNYPNFSSGESILMGIFTEIIANIENESLLVFDEPEIHLHPNAISNLMRMINKLLNEFNSYCIIATHSPLVIQEVPAKYVRVFERIENVPSIKRLEIECFGENISNIINDVFRVSREESNYKVILSELLQEYDTSEINEMFAGKLSFNASTFLNMINEKWED